MIKRNKKIGRLLVTAMCTSLVTSMTLGGYSPAFAEATELIKEGDDSSNPSDMKDLSVESDENETFEENKDESIENQEDEINEEQESDDSEIIEEESIVYNEGSSTWTYVDGEYTSIYNNLNILNNRDVFMSVTITGTTVYKIEENIPSYVTVDGIEYPVRNIGDNAFLGKIAVKDLKVPNTVKTIGSYAFAGIYSETIDVPEGVTTIGDGCFSHCRNLKSITLPNSLTTIGENILDDCQDNLQINVRNTRLKDKLINKGINANRIKVIPSQLDSNNECIINNIRYKKISDKTVSVIGIQNVSENINIRKEVTIDNVSYKVGVIEKGAFKNVSGIKKITLPDYIFEIGDSAFENCKDLVDVDLYYGCKHIDLGKSLFKGCTKLESVPSIFEENTTDYMFSGCSSLKSHSYKIESIAKNAFENCTSLTNIDLRNCKSISKQAFLGCTNLSTISNFNKIQNIGSEAFLGCTSLRDILIESDELYHVSSDIFNNCSDKLRIYANEFTKKALINSGIDESIITDNVLSTEGTWGFGNQCTIDGIVYQKGENNTAIIKSTASNSNNTDVFDINIPEKIIVDDCEYTVTEVAGSAFSNTSKLLSKIKLPNTITKIDAKGLYEASAKTIILPDNLKSLEDYTFAYCNTLTSIVIPDSIESVGANVFRNCDKVSIMVTSQAVKDLLINSGISESIIKFKEADIEDCSWNENNECIVNGIKYRKNEDSSVSIISSDWNNLSGDVTLDSSITVYGVNYTVTGILDAAFEDNINLTSLHIPNSIKNIGNLAFNKCYNLKSVYFPHEIDSIGNGIFKLCSNLEDVQFPENLTSVPEEMFSDCIKLKEITLPSAAKSIGKKAFTNCSTLQKVNLPEGIETIGENAFYYCKALKNINLPQSIETIKNSVFYGCYSLNEIIMPESLKAIGSNAFRYCIGLNHVKLNSNLKEIASYSFYGCTSLSNVELVEGLEVIGENAFQDCEGLAQVDLPESLKVIKKSAFNGSGLKQIKFPSNMNDIEESAFRNCSLLENLYLPEGLTTIKTNVIEACDNLKKIVIPKSVTRIQTGFGGLSKLESLQILSKSFDIDDCVFNEYYDFYDRIVETPEIKEKLDSTHNGKGNLNIFLNEDHIVNFELYGGQGVEKLYGVTPEDEVPLPADPVKNHCQFLGWYKDENFTEKFEDETLTGGITLHAKWQMDDEVVFDSWNSDSSDSSISINGIKFKLDKENKKASISGYDSVNGKVTLPALINVCGENYSVTAIGENAFKNCTDLTYLTMPDTIEDIKDGAFCGCIGLTHIDYSNNLKTIGKEAFKKCSSLTNIVIPEGTKEISDEAYSYCNMIEEVTIPEGVEIIGKSAFYGCANLKKVNLPSSLKIMDGFEYCAKLDNVVIPEGVEKIGGFKYCYDLKNIVIPQSVKEIDHSTFYKCKNLKNITLPQNLQTIGRSAFGYCTSLESIVIPEGVTELKSYLFNECSNLRNVSLGDHVTTLEDAVFSDCSSLESIYLPDTITYMGNSMFNGDKKLKRANIPVNITEIKHYTFKECYNLEEVDIPGIITRIEDYAFYSCGKLKDINITDNIKFIGECGLYGCDKFTNLVLPRNMDFLGQDFFSSFHSTKNVVLPDNICVFPSMIAADFTLWTVNSKMKYDNAYRASQSKIVIGRPLKIDFELNGGTGDTSLDFIEAGKEILMPQNPVKEGFVFDGWYKDRELTDKFNPEEGISENILLYAGWKEAECPVRWDENNQCTADNIKYTLNHDNFVTVSGIENAAEDITIPSTITVADQEYLVTSVGDNAFKDCSSLRNISLGSNMYYIGYNAFSNCSNLANIRISKSVTAISPAAFSGCNIDNINFILEDEDTKNVLETAGIYSENLNIEGSEDLFVVDGIKYAVNHDNYVTVKGISEDVANVVIPDEVNINGETYIVTSIGDMAFKNKNYLRNVVLGNNICYIGFAAFLNCSSLEKITIPESVTSIGNSAFEGCNMNSLVFNLKYESTKNVLDNSNVHYTNIEI